MNLVAPYSLIAKYKVLAEEEDKNKKGDEVNSTTSPAWWELRGSNPRPSACKADALNQLS